MNQIDHNTARPGDMHEKAYNPARKKVALEMSTALSSLSSDLDTNPKQHNMQPESAWDKDLVMKLAQANTKQLKKHVNAQTNREKVNKSIRASSQSEVNFFGEFFQVSPENPNTFVRKVKEIQKGLWFKEQDGIIGPGTLRKLYTKIYKNHLEELPPDILARWKFYKVWESPRYERFKKPNVFSTAWFYGTMGTKNTPWSLKDASLDRIARQWKLAINFKWKTITIGETGEPNTIYIGKSIQNIQLPNKSTGHYVFWALYDSNGKLQVLSYISPWAPKTKSPENVTFSTHWVAKNYISQKNDPMASATLIDMRHWRHTHFWKRVNWRPLSHGCWRMPGIGASWFASYTAETSHRVIVWKTY